VAGGGERGRLCQRLYDVGKVLVLGLCGQGGPRGTQGLFLR
jgi:hypothetical protein